MAKDANPLKGLSKKEILALITDADPTDDSEDGSGFEIVLRGKGAEDLLSRLTGKKSRSYDPDEPDPDEPDPDEQTPKATWAERVLGITKD